MNQYTPLQYILIAAANAYGLDKLTYEERIQAVREGLDPTKAEDPHAYYKYLTAYNQAIKGQPIHTPIYLDAVSSVLQIISCLGRDYKACKLTGLINTGNRPDPYTDVYNYVQRHLETDVKVTRTQVKDAVMQYVYGGTKTPKQTFGEENFPLLMEAIAVLFPYASEYLDVTRNLLTYLDPDLLRVEWTLPDNHHISIPLMDVQTYVFHEEPQYEDRDPLKIRTAFNTPPAKYRAFPANIIHSIDAYILRTLLRYCSVDRSYYLQYQRAIQAELNKREPTMSTQQTDITQLPNYKTLSTEQLNDLNGILKELVSYPSFSVLTIHDSFGCLPIHCNQLRHYYNLIMARLSRSELIENILTTLDPSLDKSSLGKDIYEEILTNDYAIN